MSKGDEGIFRGADEIKQWSEDKMEIIGKYTTAYTTVFKNKRGRFNLHYIDAFCGMGMAKKHSSGEFIPGSPVRALIAKHKFDSYYFIDQDENKTKILRELCNKQFPEKIDKINIRTGDSNDILPSLLAQFSFASYDRLLCVLDPYGMHLDWSIMESLGKNKIADMILNFPIMDINRNATRRIPEQFQCNEPSRMDRLWGDESWRDVAYEKTPGLFGDMEEKAPYDKIAPAYQQRLKDIAGFKFVPNPVLMKNSSNAPLYYLFFATNDKTADKIARDLFKEKTKS